MPTVAGRARRDDASMLREPSSDEVCLTVASSSSSFSISAFELLLALEVTLARAARLADRDERVGEELRGLHLLDGERLGARAGRDDDDAVRLVALGHERREERAAILEPAEERAQIGAPDLERVQHVDAHGAARLALGDVEQHRRQLGRLLLEVAGGVDRIDACRMQYPELGLRGAVAGRLAQAHQRLRHGRARLAIVSGARRVGERLEESPLHRQERLLELRGRGADRERRERDEERDQPGRPACGPRWLSRRASRRDRRRRRA